MYDNYNTNQTFMICLVNNSQEKLLKLKIKITIYSLLFIYN